MKDIVFVFLFVFSFSVVYGQTTEEVYAAIESDDLLDFHKLVESGLDTTQLIDGKNIQEIITEKSSDILFYLQNSDLQPILVEFEERNNECFNFYTDGNLKKAIDKCKSNKEFAEQKLYGTSFHITSLNNVAVLLTLSKDYDSSLKASQNSLEIIKKKLGEYHPDYANSLMYLAHIYKSKGDYENAISTCKSILKVREEAIGKTNSDYIFSLTALANLYQETERYEEALFFYQSAVQIKEEMVGKNHPDYATTLNRLAIIHQLMDNYEEALILYKTVLKIREKTLGKKHFEYLSSINNLASLYTTMAAYDAALPLYQDAIKIRKEISGDYDSEYATYLNNLACLYYLMGKYEEALSLHQDVLKIRKKKLGESHPHYASSLNNLALLYLSMRSYELALSNAREALKINEANFGNRHPEYIVSLNNMANSYLAVKNYEEAEKAYKYIIEVKKNTVGENHSSYTTVSNSLAELYYKIGKYDSALLLVEETINIRKESLGENHPDYATSLALLANIYSISGDYIKALNLQCKVLNIRKRALGENHPSYDATLHNIGRLYFFQEKWKEAFSNFTERNKIRINRLRNNFTFLSEAQKSSYVTNRFSILNHIGCLAIVFTEEEILDEIYNISLFQKELLIQSNQAWKNLVAEKQDTTLNNIYTEWQFLSAARNKQLSIPISQRTNLTELEDKIADIEKQILKLLPEYRQALDNLDVTWQEVKNKLPKNAAAVEFISFDHYYNKDWTDTTYYAALILRPEYTHPEMVLLGTEKELNKILSVANKEGIKPLYARSVDKSKEASSGGNYGAALYDFMWSKTDSLLTGVETVYYSPAGNLHRVAFAGIPLPDDAGYLGEKYALHCLGTTRQVVSGISNPLAPKDGEWLLAGGINYDDEPMQPAGVQTDTSVFTFNPTAYVADRSGRESLPYLPGTQEEVKAVSDILQDKDTGIAHKVLTGNQAVEEYFHDGENFKNTSVLHIGSHGYFSPAPKTAKERQEWEMMQLNDSPFHQIDRPLLRSGLFLSGSNKAWTTSETYSGRLDGIWTAQEITELNLRHLKLATLSACETALGDIEGNEGVFGLQRAFKAAGVEKMLVSLWKVDDAATSLYIRTFYKNWLSGGGIYEAYRATQEEMKTHELYGNPYFWAGFVLLE